MSMKNRFYNTFKRLLVIFKYRNVVWVSFHSIQYMCKYKEFYLKACKKAWNQNACKDKSFNFRDNTSRHVRKFLAGKLFHDTLLYIQCHGSAQDLSLSGGYNYNCEGENGVEFIKQMISKEDNPFIGFDRCDLARGLRISLLICQAGRKQQNYYSSFAQMLHEQLAHDKGVYCQVSARNDNVTLLETIDKKFTSQSGNEYELLHKDKHSKKTFYWKPARQGLSIPNKKYFRSAGICYEPSFYYDHEQPRLTSFNF